MTIPHLVQYQGSKRSIASKITKYIPNGTKRIIEPFAGTCAVSILAASQNKADCFVLNDINEPLIRMMEKCVDNPQALYTEYKNIWDGQFVEGENNVDYFYKIRTQFNGGEKDEARMLFLLSRVVKGAIRYSSKGDMNQSCDKRRYGTKPETLLQNATRISKLLNGKSSFHCKDYRTILELAEEGDLVYMDPPYQGTSNFNHAKDNRYIQGVDFFEFVEALSELNQRNIQYIVSYDGMTGNRKIGFDLPKELNLTHLLINAGISTQSTLNGKKEQTFESLYLSSNIPQPCEVYEQ